MFLETFIMNGGSSGRYKVGKREVETKKPLVNNVNKGFKKPAIPTFTLVCTIIGSESLTSVFGKGTGMTFRIWSPEKTLCGLYARTELKC